MGYTITSGADGTAVEHTDGRYDIVKKADHIQNRNGKIQIIVGGEVAVSFKASEVDEVDGVDPHDPDPLTDKEMIDLINPLFLSASAGGGAINFTAGPDLEDGATTTMDAADGNLRTWEIGGDNTLDITNADDPSSGIIYLIQGAGGGHTPTLPGNTPSGISFSSNEGDLDILGWIYRAGTFTWTIENYGAAVTPPGDYDADAQAFFDDAADAGGALSTGEKDAWDAFIVAGKTDGWHALMKGAVVSLGSNQAARLIDPYNRAFNAVIGGTVALDNTGSTPDINVGGYLDKNFIPSIRFPGNNFGITSVAQGPDLAGLYPLASCYDGARELGIFPRFSGNFYGNAGTASVQVASSSALGTFSVMCDGTTVRAYRDGTEVGDTPLAGSMPSVKLYIHANNNNGTVNNYSPQRQAALFLHSNMTSLQYASFMAALSTLLTALGR